MSGIAHLKLLVNLAQIDGTVAVREKQYIRNIGEANQVSESEIDALFDQKHPLIVPDNLSDEEKFNYLLSLVQLMKIDERMYKEEILFCSKIASKLGYDQQVMFDLMLHVKTAAMADDEIQALQELTRKYLS